MPGDSSSKQEEESTGLKTLTRSRSGAMWGASQAASSSGRPSSASNNTAAVSVPPAAPSKQHYNHAAPTFQPMKRVLRQAHVGGGGVGSSASIPQHCLLAEAALPTSSGPGPGGSSSSSCSGQQADVLFAKSLPNEAAHNGFGQSKDDTGYSPFEASSAIPSPDLTPHKQSGQSHQVHASSSQNVQELSAMMPSKDMPGLDSEQAKKLHVALQKLIDSDLPLAHKEVVMEVALAIVEAPRNKMRCYQAPHRGLTIISAAALIVSIFSLAATLWVLFLTLDAGLVVY